MIVESIIILTEFTFTRVELLKEMLVNVYFRHYLAFFQEYNLDIRFNFSKMIEHF